MNEGDIDSKKIEETKEKIKNWLKKPDNLAFLGIIILAVAVRLYYFLLTKNQPLWWDEADYLAYAKNLAGYSTHWIVTSQHNSLFPFIVAIFFKVGFSEATTKFFVELVPSVLIILLTYLICAELFIDKKIAIISSFLMIVFWEIVFNSMRFHLEGIGLLFGYLAIYIFIKGYEKQEKIFGKIDQKWAMVIVSILVALTYALRRGFFLFGVFIFFYLIFTKQFKYILKDKYNWIALAIGISIIVIVEMFIFASPITSVAGTYYGNYPFSLKPFEIFKTYFAYSENTPTWNIRNTLLYLFWIGFVAIILNIALRLGYIKNLNNSKIKGELWAIIIIASTMAYFLFYQRLSGFDPRWFYPLLLGSFICISKGILLISDFAKKYSKMLSLIIMVLLVVYGGYYELKHADIIIKNKVNSFRGIKEVGLYMKEIASEDSITISVPVPQPAYYAEKEFIAPQDWLHKSVNNISMDEFLDAVRKNERVRYLIVTLSEPNHPSWMKKEYYAQNPSNGQTVFAKFEIPIMNTSVDFINNKQDVKTTMNYDGLAINLLVIKDDAFLYEIVHTKKSE